MSLLVIEDEALAPINVGFLGTVRIVLEPVGIAHLVEQSSSRSLCHDNESGT